MKRDLTVKRVRDELRRLVAGNADQGNACLVARRLDAQNVHGQV
jgi:hypothetical protein